MVSLNHFRMGDVYLDFPFEEARFRYEKATDRVYCRFYGTAEREIRSDSVIFHDAISSGRIITREEYEGV